MNQIDWSDLKYLYEEKHLTLKEVGLIKGCRDTCILKHLRLLGIATRSKGVIGNKNAKPKKGAANPWWRGGMSYNHGYRSLLIPDHPYASKRGYVPEHRLVMEKTLGRYLLPSEKVHHKGIRHPLGSIENKQDNLPDNLELFSCQGEHLTTIVPLARIDSLEIRVRDLENQNRLLKWQIKELAKQLQFKLGA